MTKVALILLLLGCTRAKQFKKCDFLHELTGTGGVNIVDAAKLTCIAGYTSKLRTSLVHSNAAVGVFGITTGQCTECGMSSCKKFLDDDIKDDLKCFLQLRGQESFDTLKLYKEKKCETKWQRYIDECSRPVLLQMPSKQQTKTNSSFSAFVAANIGDIITQPCNYVRVLKTNFKLKGDAIGAWACVSFDAITCQNPKSSKCKVDCDSVRAYDVVPDHQCSTISEGISTALAAVKGRIFVPRFQFNDCKADMINILGLLCPEILDFNKK